MGIGGSGIQGINPGHQIAPIGIAHVERTFLQIDVSLSPGIMTFQKYRYPEKS